MSGPEQRAAEGLVHLQGAALQLIAAARAFLDVAEDIVQDPGAAAHVVQTLSGLAGALLAERKPSSPPREPGGEPLPRVTRIPLSGEG